MNDARAFRVASVFFFFFFFVCCFMALVLYVSNCSVAMDVILHENPLPMTQSRKLEAFVGSRIRHVPIFRRPGEDSLFEVPVKSSRVGSGSRPTSLGRPRA